MFLSCLRYVELKKLTDLDSNLVWGSRILVLILLWAFLTPPSFKEILPIISVSFSISRESKATGVRLLMDSWYFPFEYLNMPLNCFNIKLMLSKIGLDVETVWFI